MAYQFHRISVLVVEDNQPMLEITKSLLVTFGVGHVIGAQNGEVGFKRFCEYNNDIIIADWMMKPMDGISFTRQVRNDPKSPNPYVPIILMTGFSEKRRVLQARDAGVTEFLVKPFNAKDLYKRLVQVIERPRQFVRAPDFFGPDRRRKKIKGQYDGPYRRESDLHSAEILKVLQEQQKEAHDTLKRIREKQGLGKGDKFNIESDRT
ncbi:MAG: response regulator [Rhodospirillales bacterium]|nr:response regulator [Rhodospirillales bacterium]MCB9995729.1 response regulator [Rhodospirillales bacterium]